MSRRIQFKIEHIIRHFVMCFWVAFFVYFLFTWARATHPTTKIKEMQEQIDSMEIQLRQVRNELLWLQR